MESTADVDVLVALFQMISADTFADTESDDMYAKVDGGRAKNVRAHEHEHHLFRNCVINLRLHHRIHENYFVSVRWSCDTLSF